MDPFWTDDMLILFRTDKLADFFPTIQMTNEQKFNSIARLTVYLSVLMILYSGKIWPIYILVVGLAVTIFLYKLGKKEHEEGIDEPTIPKHPANFISYDGEPAEYPNYATDQDGNKCQLPSQNNPFGNVQITDYNDNPNRPAACRYTDVKDRIGDFFNTNLYKDVDDIYNHNNSQRMFYTNPNTTIPNNQGIFAESLYKLPMTCKEDETSESCLRYEDVRANRFDWDSARNP